MEETRVPDTPSSSPTVLRIILARQLQALREKAGLSYADAAEVIYSSEWTVRRLEKAEGALKPLVLKTLLIRLPRHHPGAGRDPRLRPGCQGRPRRRPHCLTDHRSLRFRAFVPSRKRKLGVEP